MDDFFMDFDKDRYSKKKEETIRLTEEQLKECKKMVSYSPEMTAYIKELHHVVSTLSSVNSIEQFFEKSLLVSIDDGWGYSEFLKVIQGELKTYYGNVLVEGWIKEENYSTDKGISIWDKKLYEVKALTNQIKGLGGFAIVSYDMRNWMNEFQNSDFLRCISNIVEEARNVLIVFRIPSMDSKSIKGFEKALSSVVSVRTIEVESVSVENMRIYLKDKLNDAKFNVDEECNELLEQWICQEKYNEQFRGYKTLNKMSSELIYQKALHSEKSAENITNVCACDIQRMLTNPMIVENGYEMLQELIGMTEVKTKVKEVVAQIKLHKELEEQGKKVEKPSLHMLFMGNPGTGKTTVAKVVGRIFKQEGLLRKGHFIEMAGSDFVIGNINTTLQKVRTTCKDAYGSVLFIDEAYGMSIAHSTGNVTDEILPVLVAEMENHRDDFCVIMAGYKDEMQEFLKENSGLKSRIPHVIEFPNYSKEELAQIFFYMLDKNFEYEEELKETFNEYIQNIPESKMNDKEFSNARFVRNLYERLWGKAAYRVSLSENKEIILTKEDFENVIEEEEFHDLITKKKGKIGYL